MYILKLNKTLNSFVYLEKEYLIAAFIFQVVIGQPNVYREYLNMIRNGLKIARQVRIKREYLDMKGIGVQIVIGQP